MQRYSFWQQAINVHQLYQQDLLPLAEESLTTALDEYQFGTGDFLSLFIAERQLLTTERKAQLALHDQYAQFSGLVAAAGLIKMATWNPVSDSDNNTARAINSYQQEGANYE
jgi:outer membrane protein TolC